MPITAQGMGQPDLDTFLRAIATLQNELRTDRNAQLKAWDDLAAKLDSDGGVTDTNYAALYGSGGSGKPWPANPSAAALVVSGFTAIDMFQEEMTDYLATVETLANELRNDRNLSRLSQNGIMTKLDADGGVTDTDYQAVLAFGGSGAAWPDDPSASAIDDSALSAQGVRQDGLYALLVAIQSLSNELLTDRATQATSFDALCAKLDADAGVTDTNYAAVLGVGGSGNPWPANPSASALDLTA